MQALYEQQAHRAAAFIGSNQDRVADVTEMAVQKANDFLDRLAGKLLHQNIFTKLQGLAVSTKIEAFYVYLRQHPVAFIHAGASSAYWELVDGIGALCDATGSQWPFMTEAQRSVCLGHAAERFEHLDHLIAEAVSNLPA